MACFVVPATEAVVTTTINIILKRKEKRAEKVDLNINRTNTAKMPFSKKLGLLNKMLWGGSILLAFEHLWHGELVPFFPFFTAAADGGSLVTFFKEMATVGSAMSLLVTGIWLLMLAFIRAYETRDRKLKEPNI